MSSSISKRSRLRNTAGSIRREAIMESREAVKRLQYMQFLIDRYNDLEIYGIDPWFRTFVPGGHGIVVRCFRENIVKYIDDSNPNDLKVDAYFRQIDARESITEKPKWVPTPLPYIEKAVVVAIGSELLLDMKKKAAEADALGIDYKVLEVGDVVHLKADLSVWYRDHRFYINKQGKAMDYVRNQQDTHLNNFEGYFACDWYEVEGYESESSYKGFYTDGTRPSWVKIKVDHYERRIEEFKNIITASESEVNDVDDGGLERGEGIGFGLGTDVDFDND